MRIALNAFQVQMALGHSQISFDGIIFMMKQNFAFLTFLLSFSLVLRANADFNIPTRTAPAPTSVLTPTPTPTPARPLPFDVSVIRSEFASWGVDPNNRTSSINLLEAWRKYERSREIVIAVVDTGIDPNHTYLRGNVFVSQGQLGPLNYGMDFSQKLRTSLTPLDQHGHGTHISGTIKSVFPRIKLLTLKYYNPNATGRENLEFTVKALQYAVDKSVDIINYSGGGPEPSAEEFSVLRRAREKNILIVAAAGNESSNIDIRTNAYYPASYNLSNIISVTAHDRNLRILASSNWGKEKVDLGAPGHQINASLPGNKKGHLTGTSQATAFVSGVAGLLKSQFPGLKPQEIKSIIQSSARKETALNGKCLSQGRLEAAQAVASAIRHMALKTSPAKTN